MKKILFIIFDILVLYGSIYFSFKIFGEQLEAYGENVQAFLIISPLIAFFYLLFLYIFDLQDVMRRKLQEIIYAVFLITLGLTLSVMAVCFFVRGGAMAFPRSVILLSSICWFVGLLLVRCINRYYQRYSHGVKDVVVVGDKVESLLYNLDRHYKDLYCVKHVCANNDSSLMKKIASCKEIFISADVPENIRRKLFVYQSKHDVQIYFVPKYSDITVMNSSMFPTDDIPTYALSRLDLTVEERAQKRIFDIFLAILGCIVGLPFFVITVILVKLDGGPVFYIQERLTCNKKLFKVYKFRTMVPHAELLSGPVLSGENDPRITKVGRFLRATRLDELPQIYNVLRGDMSIVGPRPERPFFVEQFEDEMPEYAFRMKVKAGLTGLAQVMGKYNTSAAEKLRYDLMYIARYSLLGDLLIVLRTVKVLFMKESTEGVQLQTNIISEEE
ncbi:MAG: sugar transferase [Prevotella sp.]|jgi:exopolysaccharide biosynthesis polyprenyl glycosylphosphotransferase|nr:sugar transferase [Prevotella sp.]